MQAFRLIDEMPEAAGSRLVPYVDLTSFRASSVCHETIQNAIVTFEAMSTDY